MRFAKIAETSTIILLLALAVAGVAHAATTLEVGIPGVEGAAAGDTVSSVPMYIKYLYYFVLGLVGIAGFSSLVFWGAVWAGSGIVDKKAQAIAGIKNTLTGIGIALTAFILLNTINPDLIVIKTPNVAGVNITDGRKIVTGEGAYLWGIINPNLYNQACVRALSSGWQVAKDESKCGSHPYQSRTDAFTYQKLPDSYKYTTNPIVATCCFLPEQLANPSGAGGSW